ncbi:MAG: UTP--glucose-1-phosphate uridylyltransferase [Paracoccaceae bacterium]|nr:UTP--glucose-1-phosphate uridylyltransferase [Paracoccaceae bacterium]
MSRIVRKAVFPVAGFGTRFLPATKAMPKELLPVVDKPLIQYAAEEAIRAGIDTLIFVTGRNKRAIEDHFDANLELEAALRAKGKYQQADLVRNILPKRAECIFVRQAEQLGLGHAILCAERAVSDEPFAVLLADDFLTQTNDSPKSNVTLDLKNAFQSSGQTQLSVMQVVGPDISKYGVIAKGDAPGAVAGVVEKPCFEEAPSDMASIGRYVLTPDIFDVLRDLPAGSSREIQLADAINIQARRGAVNAVQSKALRFDCGSVKGFLAAIAHVSKLRNIDHN